MTDLLKKIGQADIRNILAVLYVLLVLGYIYVLAFHPVPSENKDLVNIIGGHIIGGMGVVLAFYFGASKKEKEVTKEDEKK